MWRDLLSEIQKIEQKYGSTLNKPATSEEIIRFTQMVENQLLDTRLPPSYIEFLKTANGLDFNGLVIYGIDPSLLDGDSDEENHGFLDTNEIWHENEWQKQYLFFGDSDTAWYCLDVRTNRYLELDKPSGTEMNTYLDFDSMLEAALTASMGDA